MGGLQLWVAYNRTQYPEFPKTLAVERAKTWLDGCFQRTCFVWNCTLYQRCLSCTARMQLRPVESDRIRLGFQIPRIPCWVIRCNNCFLAYKLSQNIFVVRNAGECSWPKFLSLQERKLLSQPFQQKQQKQNSHFDFEILNGFCRQTKKVRRYKLSTHLSCDFALLKQKIVFPVILFTIFTCIRRIKLLCDAGCHFSVGEYSLNYF